MSSDRNTQVLKSITLLQEQEQQQFAALNDASLSPADRKRVLTRINELSQMRVNMYSTLKDAYAFYHQNADMASATAAQQMVAVDVVEQQLNAAKKRLNKLEQRRFDNVRLAQINTYYAKRYQAHSSLLRILIVAAIATVLLAAGHNAGALSDNVFGFLLGLVLLVTGIFVFAKIVDFSNRSAFNWDEFSWRFDKSKAPPIDGSGSASAADKTGWALALNMTCIGAACCSPEQTFDSTANKCMTVVGTGVSAP
jgi:ABC-type multidrug transport system fused ATPase/permease subunit